MKGVKMKKKLIAVLAAALVITGIPAMNGTVAYAKPKTKEYVEVPPTGIDYNGADFNNISKYTEAGGYHIKLQEGATYYIQGQLRLNSNTYLEATGAKLIETRPGSRIICQPYDRKGYKKSKGFGSVHDITIDGGTWVGTKKLADSNVNMKNGEKTGTNVINFWHAKNITIKNLSVYNVYNAHIIELCGVKNAVIRNCHIGCRKVNGKLKKGFSTGDPLRGAIQLDFCSRSGNRDSKPFDNQTCQNVTIKNNYIWHKTAIQIANDSPGKTKNVKVTGNTLRCKNKWVGNRMNKVTGFKSSKNKTAKY